MGVGTPPVAGPQLVDGTWLQGVAGGVNYTTAYGLTAAGTTQATATQIPSGAYFVEVDTVPASSGLNLPPAYAGTGLQFYNNTSTTVTIYPALANNPLVSPAAQDTINNATSITVAGHAAELFWCAKNGIWAAK